MDSMNSGDFNELHRYTHIAECTMGCVEYGEGCESNVDDVKYLHLQPNPAKAF